MKTKKIFVFMISCALIFGVFAGSTFCSSAAQVNYLSETNYLINSEICNSMLLESQYGSLSTTWNPDTFLTFSNRDVLNAFGVSSGVIKQSGSSAGNRLFVYPYQGADFVFPAVDGVVDHYELIFSYLIEDCASANMARARGNSSPSVYYPFLSVDGIQLQYYTTSGTLSSMYIGGSWPEVTYTFSITRDGQTSYYTAEDTYFWDNYDFSYPVLCTLTISKDDFKKWKSDFVNFTGADIYFGGACFFYQYGFNLDDPYFTLRPTSTRLKTVYMTREDYAAIQKEEEFRNNVSSDLEDMKDILEGTDPDDGGAVSGLEDIKDNITVELPNELPIGEQIGSLNSFIAIAGLETKEFFAAFVQPISVNILGYEFDLFSLFFGFLGLLLLFGLIFLIVKGSHGTGSNGDG